MRYRQFTNIANPAVGANFNMAFFFGKFELYAINILLTGAGTLNGTFTLQGGNATKDLALAPPNAAGPPPQPLGEQVPQVNLAALALVNLPGPQAIVNGVPGGILFTGGPYAFDILNLNWAFTGGAGTCQVVAVLKSMGANG
jgi:hypothetical protein